MKQPKSKLTTEEVKHLARLANLLVSNEEIILYQMQLSKILDYISTLNKLNTDKVTPAHQVTGLQNITREDTEKKEYLLPRKGLFKVPSIFENND